MKLFIIVVLEALSDMQTRRRTVTLLFTLVLAVAVLPGSAQLAQWTSSEKLDLDAFE